MKKVTILLSLYFIVTSVGISMAFSDSDLENYKSGGSAIIRDDSLGSRATNTAQPAKGSNPSVNDAQVWCDKGRAADDRVEIAEKNLIRVRASLKTTASVYGDKYAGATAVNDAMRSDDEAKREVDAAKTAQRRLHEDAHRQGIPPGWLNCNF